MNLSLPLEYLADQCVTIRLKVCRHSGFALLFVKHLADRYMIVRFKVCRHSRFALLFVEHLADRYMIVRLKVCHNSGFALSFLRVPGRSVHDRQVKGLCLLCCSF